MKTKVALMLILIVFTLTPIIAALTKTFILPTVNAASLTKAMANKAIFGSRSMGDPIDDPVGPGTIP